MKFKEFTRSLWLNHADPVWMQELPDWRGTGMAPKTQSVLVLPSRLVIELSFHAPDWVPRGVQDLDLLLVGVDRVNS